MLRRQLWDDITAVALPFVPIAIVTVGLMCEIDILLPFSVNALIAQPLLLAGLGSCAVRHAAAVVLSERGPRTGDPQ